MHDTDIFDNGYLAKREVASSWGMRQFLIPLLTLKTYYRVLLSCIGFYWLAWVVEESFKEHSGLENFLTCWLCKLKRLSSIEVVQTASSQKKLAQEQARKLGEIMQEDPQTLLGEATAFHRRA